MGKAAAVALSQDYEVSAFRELITELKERNDAAEQNGKKQTTASQSPHFYPYQPWEPAATARRAVLAVNKLKNKPKAVVSKKKRGT